MAKMTRVNQAFSSAKRAAKKVLKKQGGLCADVSAVHNAALGAAIAVLGNTELASTLAWQAVHAARA